MAAKTPAVGSYALDPLPRKRRGANRPGGLLQKETMIPLPSACQRHSLSDPVTGGGHLLSLYRYMYHMSRCLRVENSINEVSLDYHKDTSPSLSLARQ